MSKVKALLQGFVDTHVHAGPTLTVREFDIWQLIQEAETGDFAAMVLKDHFIPTVPIARAIQAKLRRRRRSGALSTSPVEALHFLLAFRSTRWYPSRAWQCCWSIEVGR